ncbi:MAG: hypothetical protein ABJZ55_02075 [Fuerstiella sp.]
MFGTDQVLMYNVNPWNELGFGVANFGDNPFTQNAPLHGLADEIGVMQLYLMTHIDAARRQYPSRNTIERLGKTLNRIHSVLLNRAKAANVGRLEAGHGAPSAIPWNVHPVPYFAGPIVNNRWLREYNNLTMIALANIYQHSDNNLELTITEELASDIWQYFREVRSLLAGELLGLTREVYDNDAFRFTTEHYNVYRPQDMIVRVEGIDDPGKVRERFTEDDLQQFLRGIPANLIIPNLAKYPTTVNDNFEGARGADSTVSNPTAGTTDGSLDPII